MATSQFELNRASWTEVLTGPVTISTRIEAANKDVYLWEGGTGVSPIATNLGHLLREHESDFVTVADGEAWWARARADGETILLVNG